MAEAEDLEALDVGDEGDGEGFAEGEGEGEDDELEQMKKKLKEMEGEAEKLRKIQEDAEENNENGDDEATAERDSRSIYVGNVDYSVTPEDLQGHFEPAGSVEKITIPTDKFKSPKGFAYIEFSEASAVEEAVGLNDTELKGRIIKVVAKRTNVPGMGRGKGRGGRGGRGGGRGFGRGFGKGKGGYRPYYRPRYGRGRYRPY